MLALEVEYLGGVAYAANARGDGADWPPQPDRLFSALVASWAARGERAEERRALEWLERQDAPRISASDALSRSVVKVFVPPNDDRSSSLSILPTRRRRQERQFPACLPEHTIVAFAWPSEPDTETFDALDALARDTSYLGHSASLVRCRAKRLDAIDPMVPVASAKRRVYPGRLAELERLFKAKRRPSAGMAVSAPIGPSREQVPRSVFGNEWLVFSEAGGERPATVSAALVSKAFLKTVLSGYSDEPIPEWVSGHRSDGSPTADPHLAAVPLMDVGHGWSQGHLMGMALVLPRRVEALLAEAYNPEATAVAEAARLAADEEAGLFRALANVRRSPSEGQLRQDPDTAELTIVIRLQGGVKWPLTRIATPVRASLKPDRYVGRGRTWGTVTPIALDRHPKADGDVEAGIQEACHRIGLPRPRRVFPAKHAAPSGAVSARRSGRSPVWTDWSLPSKLAGRPLTHAVLSFDEPVEGPVILGAGRFVGLGLCLRLRDEIVG